MKSMEVGGDSGSARGGRATMEDYLGLIRRSRYNSLHARGRRENAKHKLVAKRADDINRTASITQLTYCVTISPVAL